MKRHTTEPQRYGHHERASIAVRIALVVKRETKPARLWLVASQAKLSDGYYWTLFSADRGIQRLLKKEARHRTRILARREQIEGELA